MIQIKTIPTIIGARRFESRRKIIMDSRPNHALVLRLGGEVVYNYDGKELGSTAGDMVFIPKGVSYEVEPVGKYNDFAIVYFDCEVEEDKMRIVHPAGITEAQDTFESLLCAIRIDGEEGRLLALSHFYRLLAISAAAVSTDHTDKKLRLITPALDYMREHLYSPELEVGSLHNLAGISAVYFRRLFAKYMGAQPSRYVTEKRLTLAKELISEGGFTLVREVAEAVGYVDPLYFSRIYKKRFGASPSASRKDKKAQRIEK